MKSNGLERNVFMFLLALLGYGVFAFAAFLVYDMAVNPLQQEIDILHEMSLAMFVACPFLGLFALPVVFEKALETHLFTLAERAFFRSRLFRIPFFTGLVLIFTPIYAILLILLVRLFVPDFLRGVDG